MPAVQPAGRRRQRVDLATLTRTEVRSLLAEAGTTPRKSLGQNFLVDANTARRIVRLAQLQPGERVVEVGAGVGSLTLALVEAGAQVLAVETDPKLVPVLRQVVQRATAAGDEATAGSPASPADQQEAERDHATPQVTVIHGDARKLDWPAVLDQHAPAASHVKPPRPEPAVAPTPAERPSWTLVANLPYNLATSLVVDFLESVPQVRRMLVMCQLEAAERLAASVGHAAYGAVSVLVALRADAELVARVPPTVFWPEPKVTSALVRLERREQPAAGPLLDATVRLVKRGFAHRRQMLRRTLGSVVPSEAFAAAGIDPASRPQELEVDHWVALASATLTP